MIRNWSSGESEVNSDESSENEVSEEKYTENKDTQ